MYLSGFHAVEERVRAAQEDSGAASKMKIYFSKPGPRVKKILDLAKAAKIQCEQTDNKTLDQMAQSLSETARDHRGIILEIQGQETRASNLVDFDAWLERFKAAASDGSQAQEGGAKRTTVVILDSVTDPHNVGAVIRSADQFGADLVILPERRGANDVENNEIIARSSAGAASWVPVSVVTNLARAANLLKEAGFWIYGADAGGVQIQDGTFSKNSVLVMGSEGNGIARLLKETCDTIVSIPTCGRIDSLNVSVAAGVLLYEIYRQELAARS
ncbi:MAG: 23S rRNA (guanosine(2251)-2'-O)-methyltransferase RlmB [Treponema sp.]|nr:23S rRNA (guanosine(2251)-2'-O)-methyltransferase RlmB [Treponema sp.]